MLLPNELLDSIIGELHDKDNSLASIRTLQNCSLVSRAWVTASQRGIFRRISLRSSAKQAPHLRRLISLFGDNPRLATYVKHLRLFKYDNLSTSGDWEECFTGVINELSNLDEIMLLGFNWDVISPVLAETLLRMLKYPSLTKVVFFSFVIDRFADFTYLLSSLTHLRSLEIAYLYCSDLVMPGSGELNPVPIQPLPLPRSIQLIDLELDTVDEQFLAWLQRDSCPFGYQNLRTLRLTSNGKILDYERTASIIQLAGESLRELKLEELNADELDTDVIHVGYLPNLCRLEMTIASLPWLENFFKPALNLNQQHHPLQSLTIYLFIAHNGPGDPLRADDWNKRTVIDKIFEKPVFAALEEVSLIFANHTSFPISQEEKEEKQKLLYKVLPFLAGSGKLQVKFE